MLSFFLHSDLRLLLVEFKLHMWKRFQWDLLERSTTFSLMARFGRKWFVDGKWWKSLWESQGQNNNFTSGRLDGWMDLEGIDSSALWVSSPREAFCIFPRIYICLTRVCFLWDVLLCSCKSSGPNDRCDHNFEDFTFFQEVSSRPFSYDSGEGQATMRGFH